MKPEATPWPAMLAVALRLGVPPSCFWRLSLKEWRALIAPIGDDTLSRAGFAALAQHFPDDLT
ncbi:MAG: phage tail assembly chaperone [Terricaulis sp.]